MLVRINKDVWVNPNIIESISITKSIDKYYVTIHFSILENKYKEFGPFNSKEEAEERMLKLIDNINQRRRVKNIKLRGGK